MISRKAYQRTGLLAACCILLTITACSTKKNTFTRRVYHNLTAHYNAYWNGNEALKQGVKQLEKTRKDNYNKVLLAENYGTKQEAQGIATHTQRAIDKATKVIQRHSMVFNKKEQVRWIDDSYLLIAKSNFYKQEYLKSKRMLNYIIQTYDNPIKYEAMLWLARTYTKLESYEKSQTTLDLLKTKIDNLEVPLKTAKYFPIVYADYYISQENYGPATEYLYEALDNPLKKDLNLRIQYILAQIQQRQGDLAEASRLYRQVIKGNPPYEMAFQSKINLARSFDAETGNSRDILKELNKMLRDVKNVEFQDQIYFALADVMAKEQNDSLTIHYLKMSVKTSVSNDFQKAISALSLADLYFEKPMYVEAQAYYDSTMMFLPLDYPGYRDLETKTYTLNNLVTNLNEAHTQDSLIRLANMSESDRNQIIDQVIQVYLEEERRKQEEEQERQRSLQFLEQNNRQQVRQNTGGKWYFYNPSAVSFGFTEFVKKWGQRKLEDNWRLSNKAVTSWNADDLADMPADSLANDSTNKISTDPKSRETYLQRLPMTEEAQAEAHQKILEAYNNLGLIYKEGLKDTPKAIESLETMNERYAGNVHELTSYYQLYKYYGEIPDSTSSKSYRNLILSKYPDSQYAQLITNPDYFEQLAAEKNKAINLYEETYDLYKAGQYRTVIFFCDEAISSYQESPLLPKFLFLRAIAKGQTEHQDSLVVQLKHLVNTYPNSEIFPLAQRILANIMGLEVDPETGELAPIQDEIEEDLLKDSPYVNEPETPHFYVMLLDTRKVNANATKVKLTDHSGKLYKQDNLTVSTLILKTNSQMITVSEFPNKQKAMEYFKSVADSRYIFSNIKPDAYQHFIISKKNYPVFYRNKEIDEYMTFFNLLYLTAEK